ncbi:MAG: rRNA pseudouridine synthase [Chlamydiia bacterium]|nr:rRNA pseudouridine synthase [Chlamydiia bacterium]MCP5509619.1 rRNA pseudouridine synthase [Chlamydiales bacterium]
MRLSKALAEAGVAARRKCDQLICSGSVSVNGVVVKTPQTDVDPLSDKIAVDGVAVAKEQKLYFILNKPLGFECTHKKIPGKQLVYSIFKDIGGRLFTVGRLDKDTTGLIILTNDGDFANQVIHPSSNITKEYLVKTNKEITHEHLVTISEGTVVQKVHVKPTKVKKVRRNTLKIAVKEGKKHEVRQLAAAAGLKVLELVRIRIGDLQLGSLPVGMFRPLSKKERLTLLANLPK